VTDPRVQAEWLNIRAEACHNREVLVASHPDKIGEGFAQELKLEVASWLDMLKPGIRRRTMIGVVMMFFQQFVGINAVRRRVAMTKLQYWGRMSADRTFFSSSTTRQPCSSSSDSGTTCSSLSPES
jgi:hypothetical protein